MSKVYPVLGHIKGSASFRAVLSEPLFWGLIVLLSGFCAIAMGRKVAAKK
jgi:hypothetical protein